MQTTRQSLLHRVRTVADAGSWQEFYACYAPFNAGVARGSGCTPAMAEDVVQECMATLVARLPRFEYDPRKGRFRAFLRKVVRDHVADAFRREGKYAHPADPADPARDWLGELLGDDAEAEARWDREWHQHVLVHALRRVGERIGATTMEAFRRYVVEGEPVAEVCAAMGINPNALYQQKSRVLALLRREVTELRAELGE